MAINEKDYEAVEDVVGDFSVFYDEEKEYKRNKRYVRKLKLASFIITLTVFAFITTIIGIVRMQMYDTKNVLTQNEMRLIDFRNDSEKIKDYSVTFDLTSVDKIVELFELKGKNSMQENFFAEKDYLIGGEMSSLDDIAINLNSYKELLVKYNEGVGGYALPNGDGYDLYCIFLIQYISEEVNYLNALKTNWAIYQEDFEQMSMQTSQKKNLLTGYRATISSNYQIIF